MSAAASDGRRIRFAGIDFDNVTLREAVDCIGEWIAVRRPGYVVTPNLDHVVRFQRDPEFAAVVQGAALTVADGQPLLWASRWVGRPLKERVAGSDLLPALCAEAAVRGWRVFFLGGDPGVAEEARGVLERVHPGLRVVGVYCPDYGFERDSQQARAALEAVRAASPDLLFVALGSPKQERWIAENLAQSGATVGIGIGIALSFAAGRVPRAPRWMQRSGLEWLHRLMQEPRRLWRRYLVDSWAFWPLVWREWIGGPGRRVKE